MRMALRRFCLKNDKSVKNDNRNAKIRRVPDAKIMRDAKNWCQLQLYILRSLKRIIAKITHAFNIEKL